MAETLGYGNAERAERDGGGGGRQRVNSTLRISI